MTKFTCADVGASVTRYMSHATSEIRYIPNNMVFVGGSDKVDLQPSTEQIESALDLTITKKEKSDVFPCRVLIGEMATRYASVNVTPSGLTTKTSQPINNVSIITSVALSLLGEESQDAIPVSLYVALPPVEVLSIRDKVKAQFLGEYTVTFNKLAGKEVRFKIIDVESYEESFLASLSFMFSVDGIRKPLFEKYAKGNILSLDIGASTTDLATITNRVYQERSGRTYKVGGNVVRTAVINSIMAKFEGYDVPTDEADRAVREGRVLYGNEYVNVSDIVAEAKRLYAAEIVQRLQTYFTSINIPVQNFRAILVSGGGSMSSKYKTDDSAYVETVASMTYYITQELHKVCKTIAVEEYDEDPRTANIRGLYLRAQMDLRKKAKK